MTEEKETLDPDLDVPGEDAPGRSRVLPATAERDGLERFLRLLANALEGVSPRRVADVLVEGACLVSHRLVRPGTHPGSWPVVTAALGGVVVHVPDLLASGATGWLASAPGSGRRHVVPADGRELDSLGALPIRGEDGCAACWC